MSLRMSWQRKSKLRHQNLLRWKLSLLQIASPWTSSTLKRTKPWANNMLQKCCMRKLSFKLDPSSSVEYLCCHVLQNLILTQGGGRLHVQPLLDGIGGRMEHPCRSGCAASCNGCTQPGGRSPKKVTNNLLWCCMSRSQWRRWLWLVGVTSPKSGSSLRRTSTKLANGVKRSLPRILWVSWPKPSLQCSGFSGFLFDVRHLHCSGAATVGLNSWLWRLAHWHQESQVHVLYQFCYCYFIHRIFGFRIEYFRNWGSGSLRINSLTTSWSSEAFASPWIYPPSITTGRCQGHLASTWWLRTIACPQRAQRTEPAVAQGRRGVFKFISQP